MVEEEVKSDSVQQLFMAETGVAAIASLADEISAHQFFNE